MIRTIPVAVGLLACCGPAATVGSAQTGAASTGYVAVDSSRLYYEECGRGPAVVFVHDGVMAAASWDAMWPELCNRFHALRYDRRGVGRSTSAKIAFSQITDLATLLAARRIPSATIVGSSAGSSLAIELALEHPALVERLVLLGPVVRGVGFSDHFLQRDSANIDPARRGDARAAASNQANDPYMLAPGHEEARRKILETLLANPQNLQGARARFQDWPSVPAAARLGDVRVPTFILVGEHDIPDVHAHAGAIEMGIWGARREVVRDAGHLIQLDRPALLIDRLTAFIAETPTATVPVERLQMFAGTYSPMVRAQPGRFYVNDGRLMLHIEGGRDVPLFAASDSAFYALTGNLRVTFVRDQSGKIAAADVTIRGVSHRAAATGRGP